MLADLITQQARPCVCYTTDPDAVPQCHVAALTMLPYAVRPDAAHMQRLLKVDLTSPVHVVAPVVTDEVAETADDDEFNRASDTVRADGRTRLYAALLAELCGMPMCCSCALSVSRSGLRAST